jgi:hypothetical protein
LIIPSIFIDGNAVSACKVELLKRIPTPPRHAVSSEAARSSMGGWIGTTESIPPLRPVITLIF